MTEIVLYKRHLKSGVYFYVKYFNHDSNKYDVNFSVEKLKELLGRESNKRTRNRPEATSIALEALEKGIVSNGRKKHFTFVFILYSLFLGLRK
ncbi:MAG: hypothetical protein ACI4NI_11660 [Candidatus Ornithospirochaeta sp.]